MRGRPGAVQLSIGAAADEGRGDRDIQAGRPRAKDDQQGSGPFTDFPMSGVGTAPVINGAGKPKFEFTVPDNAAFFRVHAP